MNMSIRIVDIREATKPISSAIRNAYIDFSRMTVSLVAVVTDAMRDGRRVVGYGFNSNGRYGQGGLIRERFAPRLLEAEPASLLNDHGDNLDPDRVWRTLMTNEKPGGHGERSVAVGTIDMAVWDAVAKIAGKPLFRLLAERHGAVADPRVFVYAAGGYYYPGKNLDALCTEMRSYLDRGYTVVKMKIGGASIEDDRQRIEAVLKEIDGKAQLAVDANGRFDLETAIAYAKLLREYPLRLLFRTDGDRREPLQPSGRAEPAPIRGHAAGSRLVAVRLRAVVRIVRVSAHVVGARDGGLVPAAVYPAWRAPDVAEHRGRPGVGRQRELSRPVPAVRGIS
jgi:L-alanine-DL-glutamate epimerase-like enolase superfamily enzyme